MWGPVDTKSAPELIEREQALAAVSDSLDSTASGGGGALLLEGAPGLGKTEIIASASRLASDRGISVRVARGGELEQSFVWGIARELLAGAARELGDVSAAGQAALGLAAGGSEDPVAVAFALSELCADLSSDQPLALLVDDAHWADPLSLGWLAYLAPRIRELPVGLILAARPRDPRRPPELAVLAGRDGVRVQQLMPLSREGAGEFVRRKIPDVDEVLADQCHSATGGNAFLLSELLRELRIRNWPVAELDVSSIAIDRVDRVIERRLAAAGPNAERLAGVAALLGSSAALADAAVVGGLDAGDAHRAADALRAADVLEEAAGGRLVFTHPLIRNAVQRSVPSGQQSLLHLRAARHLAEQDELPERVGVHLLAVEPGVDRWTRARLIAAGDAALSAGAARNAVALYQRAVAERVGGPDPKLLSKLGRAAMRIDPAAAEKPLVGALAATGDPIEKVPLALDLALVLQTLRRSSDAVPVLEGLGQLLKAAQAPRSVQLRVEAELLAQSFFSPQTTHLRRERLPKLAGTLTGVDEEEALIVVQQVVDAINTGTSVQVRDLAERAWAGGRLEQLAGSLVTPAVMWIPYARLYIDDYAWTTRLALDWVERARLAGSTVLAAFANAILSEAQWRAGDCRDAHASGQVAWDIAREIGSGFPGWWMAIGVLAQALLATGHADRAFALLRDEGLLEGQPPEIMLMPMPRAIRGEVLIAGGELGRGVEELLDAHTWLQRQQEPSPGCWRFYGTLIDGLLALERREEAADTARAWLRRTRRFGTPSTRGMAERAVGLCATGDAQLQALRRAEQTLAASPARVEHARGLLELGAALRRSRQRRDAREPLRNALDLATRCFAAGLAERARVELLATGARPRRASLTGADALTASERRIAQLASDGLSNREIAAALFISRKTVESHLGSIYLKLETNDRRALVTALTKTKDANSAPQRESD